jgi:type II secretion system protein N
MSDEEFTSTAFTQTAPPAFGLEAFPPSLNPDDATKIGVEVVTTPPTPLKKTLSLLGWCSFGFSCLVFFTILKLPDDRLKEIVQGNISNALAQKQMSMTAGKTVISLFPRVFYSMSDITLNLPPPQSSTHIDRIEVAPSFAALFTGKLGASITIDNADGNMSMLAAFRGSHIAVKFNADKMDLGKVGLLPALAGISGSLVVTGKGSFSIDGDALNQTDGELQLALSHILIDSQAISGFNIPKISISQGKLDMDMNQGRGVIKSLNLGQQSSATDDIKANFSGDLNLGKTLQMSTINVRGTFSFSTAVLKGLSLLEMILAPGKQPDGSYSYKIAGPLLSPNPSPAGPNGT